MGLLNLFNNFTRRFRQKKKRKTRRRKGAGQGKYSDIAREAMMNATGKAKKKQIKEKIEANKARARVNERRKLRRLKKIGRSSRYIRATVEDTSPEDIMKAKSGRKSPPPQYPGKGPGIGMMGGGRKTRRRKGKGYSKIHKEMFKKKHCEKNLGGRWENGKCIPDNPQSGQLGGRRRRRTRRRRRKR